MATVIPQFACVRPRARLRSGDIPLPIEDLLEEYVEDHPRGVLWIDGPAGAGKSTALAHLAIHFKSDSRFLFIDDVYARPTEGIDLLVVASNQGAVSNRVDCLRLEPWGFDELVEYLLVKHREECHSVIERLGKEAHQRWCPEIARVILDTMASNASLHSVESAILTYLADKLDTKEMSSLAKSVSFVWQTNNFEQAQSLLANARTVLSDEVRRLLRHDRVQVLLAAEQIADQISSRSLNRVLSQRLSPTLVQAVADRIAQHPAKVRRLQSRFKSYFSSSVQPMVASILYAVDPGWQPAHGPLARLHLAGGYFSRAQWQEVQLPNANLSQSDLSDACLKKVSLTYAVLLEAQLSQADLCSANLEAAIATRADFYQANMKKARLRRAKLHHARLCEAMLTYCDLVGADLTEADLTEADLYAADLSNAHLLRAKLADCNLSKANLTGILGRDLDFRSVELEGATAERANFCGANFEDVTWQKANLCRADLTLAHLTGSCFSGGNLQQAKLMGAGLGEIQWEDTDLRGADLSGATFHMGSSRSGLVGSPYASEGTRTGFYTDELEELYFKRPEEIRKANLRGADLRGANIKDVDFYLVDLRDAKLDPRQLRQVQQTGAILSENQGAA